MIPIEIPIPYLLAVCMVLVTAGVIVACIEIWFGFPPVIGVCLLWFTAMGFVWFTILQITSAMPAILPPNFTPPEIPIHITVEGAP